MKESPKKGLVFLVVGSVLLFMVTQVGKQAIDDSGYFLAASPAVSTFSDICPKGMRELHLSDKRLCIDTYEESTSDICRHTNPRSQVETRENLDDNFCNVKSKKNAAPWTFVTLHQAKTLCAKKGMRLPTPEEWYVAALGTPDTSVCNTDGSGVSKTGSHSQCISASGAIDMIGNVWEWVDTEIINGEYKGRKLPESGYVFEVDSSGIVTVTSATSTEKYNYDYVFMNNTDVRGMLRGGFYAGGSDSGIFSIHTKITPSFSSEGTGFRCVKDLY